MTKEILRISNVYKKIGDTCVLQNINLEINRGDFVSIIGPSGSGKTSLAKIILGIDQDYRGIVIRDLDVKIGFVPQKINLNENLPITCREYIKIYTNNLFCESTFENYCAIFNLSQNVLTQDIKSLSGGQLQRLMIIAALCTNPDVLILDEPTQGLDVHNQSIVYEAIYKYYNKKQDATILMISHDLNNVFSYSTNVICINNHICCMGKPLDVQKNNEYNKLFYKYIAPYNHDSCHNHNH